MPRWVAIVFAVAVAWIGLRVVGVRFAGMRPRDATRVFLALLAMGALSAFLGWVLPTYG